MRNPFAIYTGSEVRILTTVNIHRGWKRRVQCFGAALLAMSMLAGCGTSQTAKQAESESTEENLVLMEETLPQTAADETVMALSPDGPLLPSVEGVDAEYSEPIPDYLRIGEKHPIVLKLQQRLMDLGFERYEGFTALSEGETVRVLPVTDGTQDTVYICAGADLTAPVPKGEIPSLEYDMPDSLPAGMQMGDTVGEARLLLDGRTLASVPLVLTESLTPRDYAFELERVLRSWPLQSEPLSE